MQDAEQGAGKPLALADSPGDCAELGARRVPACPGHHVGADNPPAGAAHAGELMALVTEAKPRGDLISDP